MDFTEILNKIIQYTGFLVITCLVVNVVLCFFYFKRISTPFKRLAFFLVWCLITEISARIFAYYDINNLPLLHLYTLGEFILLTYFYESLIENPSKLKRNISTFIIIGSLLIIANSLFLQSIYEFNTLAKTSVQIIVIIFAVLYFYNLTENKSLSHPSQKELRLINSAIIIYYSASLFIFMCSQISFESRVVYRIFWIFNAFLNFIFQLLILWSLSKVVFRKTPFSF